MSQLNLLTDMKFNTAIFSMIILEDNRIALCSEKGEVYILNKRNLNVDIKIIDNNIQSAASIIQTRNGNIIIGISKDIKIYSISKNTYNLIQTLSEHEQEINHLRELASGELVSSSHYGELNFYCFKNDKYEHDFLYKMINDDWIYNFIEVKLNQLVICSIGGDDDSSSNISFINIFDINNRKLNKIGKFIEDGSEFETFSLISEDILAFCHIRNIIFFNINKSYKMVEDIPVYMEDDELDIILCILKYDKNHFITCLSTYEYILWEFNFNDNKMKVNQIARISKQIDDKNFIRCITKDKDGNIISGDNNGIKIWKIRF